MKQLGVLMSSEIAQTSQVFSDILDDLSGFELIKMY